MTVVMSERWVRSWADQLGTLVAKRAEWMVARKEMKMASSMEY